MNRTRNRLVLTALAWLAIAGPQRVRAAPENDQDDQALRAQVEAFSRDIFSLDKGKAIVAHGQRASDAILEAVQSAQLRGGGRAPKGSTPIFRPTPINGVDALLVLLDRIDVPLPVDRLCGLVEMGIGQSFSERNLDAVLSLLASSGHPKGLTYIKYERELAAKSASATDRLWLAKLDRYIRKWGLANQYIHDGQPPTVKLAAITGNPTANEPYVVSAATMAMRRLYQENPKALEWNGSLDPKYLTERFKAVFPLLRDPEKSILSDYAFFGRLYEPQLAPLIQDWLDGKKEPFETAYGGTPVSRHASGSHAEFYCFAFLTNRMTGDLALKIKLRLLQGKDTGDWRSLEYHNPDLWVADVLKVQTENLARTQLILSTLATLERPLNEQEKNALPDLLRQHKIETARWDQTPPGGDPEWRMVNLANREPQAFAQAFDANQHLSMPVVHAVWKAGLCKDTSRVFEKIEYAMLHDYDTNMSSMTPEKLAKLPPALQERLKGQMNKPAHPRINAKWLELGTRDFADSPEWLQFMRKLAADPDFDGAKRDLNIRIAQYLKAHPDAK